MVGQFRVRAAPVRRIFFLQTQVDGRHLGVFVQDKPAKGLDFPFSALSGNFNP
jgi:hypothetical protein